MSSHFKGPDPAVALPEFQPNTSVLKLLEHALRKNGHATAMVEGQTGRTVTFKDLHDHGISIATGLRKRGVTAGDYVILCCDKSIAAYSALLGVIFTGATAVLFPIPHIDKILEMTRGFPIKAVFCDPQHLNNLKKSLSAMTVQPVLVVTIDPEDEEFGALTKTEGEVEVYKVRDVQKHVVMIFFSSGTTGIPKGIQISDVSVQLCGRYLRTNPSSLMVLSPMFWLSALLGFMSSVFRNYRVIISNSRDSRENLQLIKKYQVDEWFIGNCGAMTRAIHENYDVDCLRSVLVGGETILSSVVEKFKTKVLRGNGAIISGYGTTEGPLLTFLDRGAYNGSFPCGLCGYVNPGAEIKILDEKGNIAPIGSIGEIWGKSPGLTPGYWGQPELNREVFDEDGFFRNGDVGFFNAEGQLFLRGRVGDLIHFRDTKVSPTEVEDVLMSHPAVLDAAVVGKPHPSDTQHVTAYVVKVPGTRLTDTELQRFVNDRVEDKTKLRGGVHFLDSLPRSVMGKVTRKNLREM